MDDTISRQAAIDIADDLRTYISVVGYWAWIERLKKLPSAQTEIIRCKDCKHYNAGFECLIEGYGIERNKNWYCADAERRTDG